MRRTICLEMDATDRIFHEMDGPTCDSTTVSVLFQSYGVDENGRMRSLRGQKRLTRSLPEQLQAPPVPPTRKNQWLLLL